MSLSNLFQSALITRQITLGFVLAMGLILVSFGISVYSYNRYRTDNDRVVHTQQVTAAIEDVLSLLKDVETGVPGYGITDDPLFLESYQQARPRIQQRLMEVRRLVADNRLQALRADSLAKLVQAKLTVAERQVVDRTASRPTRVAYMRLGKIRMDDTRRLVNVMLGGERQLLEERTAQASRSFRMSMLVLFALLLLTMLVLIVSYNLLERELTRRQQNEEQLRQYEEELHNKIRELEVSNQELERFAFVASHDMQEPLRKIQSFGALVQERYRPQLDDEGQMFLDKIIQSAARMSKLIRDLLNFSRLTADQEGFEPVRLNDVVKRVLDDQEVRIKALGAKILVDRLPTIDAVPSQMTHLFTNLISNALKFTRPNVPPVLRIQAIPVDGSQFAELLPARRYWQITVTDNGIGFEEKYLGHIFKVFQRLHGKHAYEGTGIGLAICKRIVMAHRGLITARSVPNEGATFVLVLPEQQTQTETELRIGNEAHQHTLS